MHHRIYASLLITVVCAMDTKHFDTGPVTMREARDQLYQESAWASGQFRGMQRLPISSFTTAMMMRPNIHCPLEFQRAGSTAKAGGQGRFLCGLKELLLSQKSCTVYSFGSNFDWSFEGDIQDRAQQAGHVCDIHIFDPTLGPPSRVVSFRRKLQMQNITLHELALTGDDAPSIRLPIHRASSGSSNSSVEWKDFPTTSLDRLRTKHSCVDILKMDVEGVELSALGFGQGPQPRWCAGMLLMEFHPDKLGGQYPSNLGMLMSFMHWLEAANMTLYYSEIVGPATKYAGRKMELAFVNTSWMSAVSAPSERNTFDKRHSKAVAHDQSQNGGFAH